MDLPNDIVNKICFTNDQARIYQIDFCTKNSIQQCDCCKTIFEKFCMHFSLHKLSRVNYQINALSFRIRELKYIPSFQYACLKILSRPITEFDFRKKLSIYFGGISPRLCPKSHSKQAIWTQVWYATTSLMEWQMEGANLPNISSNCQEKFCNMLDMWWCKELLYSNLFKHCTNSFVFCKLLFFARIFFLCACRSI